MIKKTLNASLIFHIIKLSDTIKKYGDTMTQAYGITTQQWLILLLLAKDPNMIYHKDKKMEKPMLAKDLADAMNVSRANITNLLRVLIRKKMIVQIEDDLDKRNKKLLLTREGERVISELEIPRHKGNERLLGGFSKLEKEQLIAFVQAILMLIKRGVKK
jgi:DNA-binding MarR family transcriptional regulator